jgi:hypothetical protein
MDSPYEKLNPRVLGDGQLSLDLGFNDTLRDRMSVVDRRKQAAELLKELALSLGEIKAAAEIESFRRSLVQDWEDPPSQPFRRVRR